MFTEKLFKRLVTFGDKVIEGPQGVPLLTFLSTVCGMNQAQIRGALRKLELLGYIRVSYSAVSNPVQIRILNRVWDPERTLEFIPTYEPQEKRKFAVFIDYKNLEDSFANQGERLSVDRFRDFSWLIDPILEEGIIVFAFVFIPEQLSNRPAIMQLSYRHRFFPVICPRQIEGLITKDKDTVDTKMIALGKDLIEHSDCTDVVIVGGDGDFTELANFAIWRQKRVQVMSTPESLSKDFLELEGKRLHVQLLDKE